MFETESVPFAPSLIESMRSLGYSFQSAIADLVDNSISANASKIDIFFESTKNPYLIIFDNGQGMDRGELEEAMRYGSKSPLDPRVENDLGRFGLGLKSASLSQCRELIVVSKKNFEIASYSWNIDYIIKKKKWNLIGYEESEIQEFPMIDLLDEVDSGTYVLLRHFDRIAISTGDLSSTLNKYMDDTIDHLALVFHRYLNEGLKMSVNYLEIEERDPFLEGHKSTQHLREQKLNIENEQIKINPYILPHLSKLSKKDLNLVGGRENLRKEQGFYIYRNKRLIIWGTWFRLEGKNELSKLARVRVDIPNSLDYMWSIDIKKSSASLPDIIKKKLYNSILESTIRSESVHQYRGRRTTANSGINYIWERIEGREGFQYKINRELPQLGILKNSLNEEQGRLLESLISTIEDAFPTSTLYLDASKGKLEERVAHNTEQMEKEILEQLEYAHNNNMEVRTLFETFMKLDPYCSDKNLRERLEKEVIKYE